MLQVFYKETMFYINMLLVYSGYEREQGFQAECSAEKF